MVDDLEQEVGVHTESGTADVDTNHNASDATQEPAKRTIMDMFRNGTDEAALTANNVENTDEKIGGDYSDYVMNITVKNALKTRGVEAERVIVRQTVY